MQRVILQTKGNKINKKQTLEIKKQCGRCEQRRKRDEWRSNVEEDVESKVERERRAWFPMTGREQRPVVLVLVVYADTPSWYVSAPVLAPTDRTDIIQLASSLIPFIRPKMERGEKVPAGPSPSRNVLPAPLEFTSTHPLPALALLPSGSLLCRVPRFRRFFPLSALIKLSHRDFWDARGWLGWSVNRLLFTCSFNFKNGTFGGERQDFEFVEEILC